MTASEDKPVDREAWRHLLAGDGEGPPELTDARIRARARRAITPRVGRWWLPASLAASLLLAVVLVQRQYERSSSSAVVSESQYAVAPAADQAAPPREEATYRAQLPPPPEAPAPQPESDLANASSPAIAERRVAAKQAGADSSRLDGFVAPPPVVPPPKVELPATSDARATSAAPAEAPAAESPATVAATAESKRDEEDLQEIIVSGNRQRTGNAESNTPVTQVTAADVDTQGVAHSGGLLKSGVAERTPEDWYAEIEKLRAAGKKREAKRELEKLKKAHPGWLENNHPTER